MKPAFQHRHYLFGWDAPSKKVVKYFLFPRKKQRKSFMLFRSLVSYLLFYLFVALLDITVARAQTTPTDGPGGPILVLSTSSNPFSRYYVEILRAEGLNAFAAKDISQVSATDLNSYSVIILGEMSLSSTQVNMLSSWVNAGGILIAMRPDAQLATLLGITPVNNTLSNKYLLVNTTTEQGKGIVGQTIQYHGPANLYNLNGATSVATLYSDASTATSNPAVTVNKVGSNGGQAIAFAYDLARSIVYTRQGNPSWAGQERDGTTPIRSDDQFFGNAQTDPQTDWIDLNKVAIPQADEQQHLLANIIIKGNADKMPIPRFWFLPRGLKAAVVMTGDDHGSGGTAGRFDQYKSLSSSNTASAVADWQAIRSTSYIFPGTPITNAQIQSYQADGFEIALHLNTGCNDWTPSSWQSDWSSQLQQLKSQLPALATVVTNRTHCIVWSDWASEPKMELNNGVRLDVNYYYWPDSWIQNRSGMFTGSGMPMRFADLNGSIIDCYHVTTQMTDESGQVYPDFIDQLLDNAIGANGYYGVFCANMHTDNASSTGSDAIISSALARNIPVISSKQMLTWLDGRNNSTFNSMSWNNNVFSFSITAANGARNLEAMLPMTTTTLKLQNITVNGSAVTIRRETIKGIEYAFFPAATGNYVANYVVNTCVPPTATLSAAPSDCGHVALKLSAAGGQAPYAVIVNGTTYTNVNLGQVFATVPVAAGLQSIWGSGGTPQDANYNDGQPIEVGVKFRVSQSGTITGIRFYKGTQNTGTHTGSLWTSTGTKLASASFANETASGWQEVQFSTPVSISANTTYVASYYSSGGGYAATTGFFTGSGVTSGALTAFQSGVDGGNGVYLYGGGFPTQTYNGSNYWVDVLYVPGNSSSYTFTLTGITDVNDCNNTGNVSTATVTQSDMQTAGQQTFYQDNDKDGYGNPAVTITGCTAPSGYVAQAGDCNDNNANINPGATEICGNGVDDNCNGTVDENCVITGSNLIVTENQKPGNPASEWDISGAGDPSIQGFATDISVNKGETVRFKIKTDASAYSINIYRLGYYNGNGARKVGTGMITATLPQIQPAGLTDAATGLMDCGNWGESAHWDVPADAVSGIYIAKLTRSDNGGASHIVFIVRDDASTSALFFQTSDATWQAYNGYGGNSLYVGNTSYPGGHAAKVSYNRPFITRNGGAGSGEPAQDWLFNAEYPMIRWLERNGYDMTYTTDVDADRRGSLIKNHKIFLSVGHDEYWSGQQRANVEAARNSGIHLAFFSGNEVYWKTRWETSIDGSGTAYRTLVCYKEGTMGENACGGKCDPLSNVWTGLWRDGCSFTAADGCRPENALSGQISWYDVNGAITVPATYKGYRFWRNTSIANLNTGQTATLSNGTLGYEWDYEQNNGKYPAGRVRMSQTTVSGKVHQLSLYRHSSGALVFGAGTVQWSWGLDGTHDRGSSTPDPNIQQATVNILADMGAQPGSLQGGLVAATATNDSQAPNTTITAPKNGSAITPNTAITISGTATETSGVVAGVEVSVDGGATWLPANGTANWSYSWTPTTNGSYTIKSRAVDDMGNLETATTSSNTIQVGGTNTCTPPTATLNATAVNCQSVTLKLASATGQAPYTVVVNNTTYNNVTVGQVFATIPVTTGEQSIWGSSGTPQSPNATDNRSIEVGVKFRASQAGVVTGIRFYKGTQNTGTHTGSLWSSTGTRLATATFTKETASGWQEVRFSTPVTVAANTTYVVSYYSPGGRYASTTNYFTSSGVTSGALTALQSGVSGANGVYRYGAGFPNQSFKASNYWVDVLYKPNTYTYTYTLSSIADVNNCRNTGTISTATATINNNCTTANSTSITRSTEQVNQVTEASLSMEVMPNPTQSYFTLQIQGAAGKSVTIKVLDAIGRVVEARQGMAARSSLAMGHNYRPGVYYVQAIQGSEKVVVKVVKLAN